MYHNVFPFLLHKMVSKNKQKRKKMEMWMGCCKSGVDKIVKNKVADEFCLFPTIYLYVFD